MKLFKLLFLIIACAQFAVDPLAAFDMYGGGPVPQPRLQPAFTSIFSDYRLAKPHTSFDFGNIHSYQGNRVPSSSLEMNITRFNNILPVGGVIKPFTPSECGYNVDADISNGSGYTGSRIAQAKSIPMLLAEYFRHGIRRTYLFALHNADGYGLLESDNQTKRPSYFAVSNLVAALAEARWNPASHLWEGGRDFAPQALLFDLPGAPETIHTLKVYVAGIEGMGGTFTARLSDNSAPAYVSSLWNGNAANAWSPIPDGFAGVYTITYHAASPGQTLQIEWKLSSEPNRFRGQARMQAATLAF